MDIDSIAQAIYEARFLHEPATWRRKWEDLDEPTKDIWRRCARVARGAVVLGVQEHAQSFAIGTPVYKLNGSSWHGVVVGYYSTSLTPEGYCVESEREPGSVQIYPRSALERKS